MSSKGVGATSGENDEKSALVPRLRFGTFLSERGWIPRRLGEIAQFASGGTPSKDEPSYWNGNIPWISASSMYETRIVDSELKVTTFAIGNGTRIAPKGSLLVLVRGSMLFNRVPIGVAAVDVAFNQDVKALSISGDANPTFLLYQLIAASPGIPINETGIGAGKIETDVLVGLPIYLPAPTEQQKIADCLSSLDELIRAETQKLPEHIDKIIDTYQYRREAPSYSRRVGMAEIEKNDFNLNISRYVSTAKAEEEINLAAVHAELLSLEQKVKSALDRHNSFLNELGLPPLP